MSALGAGAGGTFAPLVVVGSINVDTILRVDRLPVPGETITASSEMESHGGKGANQAVYAGALLPGVALVACVGDDDRGARALASLAHAGVDHSRVSARRARTGTATVVVDGAGENTIVLAAGANAEVDPDDVTAAVIALAGPETIVMACLEIPMAAVEAAAVAAHQVGARFVLNPAPGRHVPDSVLQLCDVLVPNAVEITQVTESGSAEAIFAAGARALVVTRGAAGAEILSPSGSSVLVPAPRVRAIDTTGAGDAFVAALTVGLHDGLRLEEAARMAVCAGAIATTGPGGRGALPTRAKIAELIAQA
jgi:ribokinase